MQKIRTGHQQGIDRQWRLGKVVPISLGIITFVNVVIAATYYTSTQSLVNSTRWVNHTNEVKADLRLLEKKMVDAETGQRGFLVTGKESYLDPYYQADREHKIILVELREKIQDNPAQLQRLAELENQIQEKFSELSQTIELKKADREQEARAIVLSDRGQQIMDEIRRILAVMEDEENDLLVSRTEDARRSQQLAQFVSLLGTGGILAIVAAIVWFVRQGVVNPIEQIASDLSVSSEQIATTIVEQERIANEQAASVHQTTTSIDELGASSRQMTVQTEAAVTKGHEVVSFIEEGTEVARKSTNAMSILETKVNKITQQTRLLNQHTVEIGNISSLLSSFAAQTNILALNAAVEAVRAGEHGKGFNVVALEIRKLADRSQSSANQIGKLVDNIKNSIGATSIATEEGSQTVEQAVELAAKTAGTFQKVADSNHTMILNLQEIAANIQQQDLAIGQIVEAMNSINQGTSQTASGMGQTKVSIQQLNQSAKRLKNLM
ncbi:chemotaxis protein [Oxynema aestuarii AP17]|uniref:Chemotaxis protein n=2 Tax=Oxynema TaxID=1492710 RepID=A0A6H1TZD6_9CYAN|nr:chemotaxis protein [Oxynema aestuarii AP17]